MASSMIQFYGTKQCMVKWREIVIATTGKPCTGVVQDEGRSRFDVELTDEDRQSLMAYWYKETGIEGCNDAQGRPLMWNDCVAFKALESTP